MNPTKINNEQEFKITVNSTNELKFSEIEEKTDQVFQKINQEECFFKPIDLHGFGDEKNLCNSEPFIFSSNEFIQKNGKKTDQNEFELKNDQLISSKDFSFELDLEKPNLKTDQKNTSIFDLYENLLTAPWTTDVKEFFIGPNGIFSDIQPNGKFNVQYKSYPQVLKDGLFSANKLYKDKIINLDQFENEFSRLLSIHMPKVCPFEIKLTELEQKKINEFESANYHDQIIMKNFDSELKILMYILKLKELKPIIESEIYKLFQTSFSIYFKNERNKKSINDPAASFSLDFECTSNNGVQLSQQMRNLLQLKHDFFSIMAKIIKDRLSNHTYKF